MNPAGERVLLGIVPVELVTSLGDFGLYLGRAPDGMWLLYFNRKSQPLERCHVVRFWAKRPTREEVMAEPPRPVAVEHGAMARLRAELAAARAALNRISAELDAAENPDLGPSIKCELAPTPPNVGGPKAEGGTVTRGQGDQVTVTPPPPHRVTLSSPPADGTPANPSVRTTENNPNETKEN